MRHLNVEALNELLRADFIEQYEYNKTFKEAAQDPFITVHTSEFTTSPEQIIPYHGRVAQMDIILPLTDFLPLTDLNPRIVSRGSAPSLLQLTPNPCKTIVLIQTSPLWT